PTLPGSDLLAPATLLWFGYAWLVCGSAYFLVRSLLDLVLVRRPALGPNLSLGGLAWLGVALLVCLTVVAVRRPAGTTATVGKRPAAVIEVQARAEQVAKQGTPVRNLSQSDTT